MKRIFSFMIVTNIFCMIYARDMVITDCSFYPITIGDKTFNKKGGVFSDQDIIHWRKGQVMKAKPKAGGLPRTYSQAAFARKSKQSLSIKQYLYYLNKTNTPSTQDSGDLYLLKSHNSNNFTEKRIALIVGNSIYGLLGRDLECPIVDAEDVTNSLNELGFDTYTLYDANQDDIYSAFQKFSDVAKTDEYGVALFYFCGHGNQNNDMNYILPIDARNDSPDDISTWISFDAIFESMEETNCKTKLVFLDACRNTPRWQTQNAPTRLDQYDTHGSYVVFSTSPNNVALGEQEEDTRNTPFGAAFLEAVNKPTENITLTVKHLSQLVRQKTEYLRESGLEPQQVSTFGVGGIDFTFYNEPYNQQISLLNSKNAKELYNNGNPIEALTLLYNSLQYLEDNPTAIYSLDLERELRYILNDSIAITKVLKGHTGKISKAYFTENNAELVSIGSDSTLILWNTQTGKAVRITTNLIKPVISPNLRYVSSGPNEKNVFSIFDIRTGKQTCSFNVGINTDAPFFTNDSEHLAVCGEKSGLTIWDIKTGEVSSKTPFYYSGFWCDLSNDGSLLAYVNKNVIELWNIHRNELLFSNSIETEEIEKAIFSKNNEFVYTFDVSGNINKFKVATGQIVNTIKLGAPIRGAFFNADEKYAILDMPDGYNLLSMESGTIIKKFSDTYRPDFFEDYILTIDRETKLFNAWDISSGNKLSEFGPYVRNKVTSISKQGQALITLPNGQIVIYDIRTGKSLGELHYAYNRLGGLTSIDNGAIIADNGNSIAVADHSGAISLWSVRNLENPEQIIITPSAKRIRNLQISSNNLIIGSDENIEIVNLSNHKSRIIESTYGNFVISGDNLFIGKDSLMIVYNIKKDKIITQVPFKHSINELEINNDKSLIAWADDYGNITLYNIATKSSDSLQSLERRCYINEILFSADNIFLIALYDYNKIAIWDIATKTIVYKQECGTTLSNVSTSSTYSKFAFSSYDGFAYIVNPRTAEIEHTLKNSFGQGFISSSLHPNKNLFMTVSYRPNNLIHIWNTTEGKLIQSLSSEKYEIRHAVFSKDGNNLYVVCVLGSEKAPSDICLKIWDVNTWNLIYEHSFGKNLSFMGEYEDYYAYMDIGASQKIILEPIKSQIFNQSIITLLDKVKTILSN